jgi:DNA-binding NtrC family response regulator
VPRGVKLCRAALVAMLLARKLLDWLVMAAPSPKPEKPRRPRPLAEVERDAILDALKYCGYDYSKAAAMLEISPRTIYRKMQKYCRPGRGA